MTSREFLSNHFFARRLPVGAASGNSGGIELLTPILHPTGWENSNPG
jgi:hypothetical protein